ncbi:hypothetical protein [Sphingopyxis macrogoltabida]|uniref:Uncharacterized protein n=1 Tax=Sphingopyxis macrogoltabida TaxID=33050 RepID=A0A0N9UWD8_SPHMC|nr:hypothetical protein [Sphingopyxis macrogoltabida]ALH80420.1 hypothetical protein AN936_08575 [Sphingopyxis macrogoltabida]
MGPFGIPPIETLWPLEELTKHVQPSLERMASFDAVICGTPPALQQIAHYASIWGVSDDVFRAGVIAGATEPARWNLKWVVHQFEEALEAWLAGPEAESENFSDAYVAFTSLVMASDEISPGDRATAH